MTANIIQQGWQCPSCYLIYSPFKDSCDCIVLRTHNSSGPLTLNESVAAREVKAAWSEEDAMRERRKQRTADQWAPEQIGEFTAQPKISQMDTW